MLRCAGVKLCLFVRGGGCLGSVTDVGVGLWVRCRRIHVSVLRESLPASRRQHALALYTTTGTPPEEEEEVVRCVRIFILRHANHAGDDGYLGTVNGGFCQAVLASLFLMLVDSE